MAVAERPAAPSVNGRLRQAGGVFGQGVEGYLHRMHGRVTVDDPAAAAAELVARLLDRPAFRRLVEVARKAAEDVGTKAAPNMLPGQNPGSAAGGFAPQA